LIGKIFHCSTTKSTFSFSRGVYFEKYSLPPAGRYQPMLLGGKIWEGARYIKGGKCKIKRTDKGKLLVKG
jgi:hypothetical protein